MSRLLWARTLGVAIAVTIKVDDAETDNISYSDGWVQCPGSGPVCPDELLVAPYDNAMHRYV